MTAPLVLVAVVDNELCKHSSSEFETHNKPNIKVASLADGNPPINLVLIVNGVTEYKLAKFLFFM